MTDWNLTAQAIATIVVGLIATAGTWITVKIQHRGKPENALIDQLQEQIDSLKDDVKDLKDEQVKSRRRERLMADYVNALRQHIEQGMPPPPPPWPAALYD